VPKPRRGGFTLAQGKQAQPWDAGLTFGGLEGHFKAVHVHVHVTKYECDADPDSDPDSHPDTPQVREKIWRAAASGFPRDAAF